MIDPNKITKDSVVNEVLERHYKLKEYSEIIKKTNELKNNKTIILDDEFKKLLDGYYQIRRKKSWRDKCYEIFQASAKATNTPTFKDILKKLYNETNALEPSFASKILATIDPSQPIWDQHVIKNVGLDNDDDLKKANNTKLKIADRIDAADSVYNKIKDWYAKNGKKIIDVFNEMFPNPPYNQINDTKKIDTVIWGIRNESERDSV